MNKDVLDEREFELVNIVGAELGSNQRDLSRMMDLSLGMTNMLIRRLISKGYIRIKQLNKKRVEYILTPKGISEKMRQSVRYMLKTINSLSLINKNLTNIVQDLKEQGHSQFHILGSSDFSVLVEAAIKQIFHSGYKISIIEDIPEKKLDGIILICQEYVLDISDNPNHCVSLIEILAKNSELIHENNKNKLLRNM